LEFDESSFARRLEPADKEGRTYGAAWPGGVFPAMMVGGAGGGGWICALSTTGGMVDMRDGEVVRREEASEGPKGLFRFSSSLIVVASTIAA